MNTTGPRLRVAVLGAGTMGREHAAAALRLGHRVVAGATTTEASPRWHAFREVASDVRFESEPAALLEAPDVDAIIAALPWDVMPQWLPQLLKTPKPVLLEKPFALSAHAALSAMGAPGAVLVNKFVAYNRRFYPSVRKLSDRLRTGGLKAAEITISETLDRLIGRYGTAIVPHVLAFSSCHILDLALHLFAPLRLVRIRSHVDSGYGAPFCSFNGLLETSAGIPVALAINADAPVAVGIRCYFADRTVWHLSPLERLVVYQGLDVVEPAKENPVRRYTPRIAQEVHAEGSEGKPGLLEQMAAFTGGNNRETAATLSQAVQVLELIEALQQSNRAALAAR